MILDMHVHSRFSFDSLSDPKDILKAAKRKGLDGIAVTDHNTIRGSLETKRVNSSDSFEVIVGAEYATDAGDIIGLFLNEEICHTRQPLEVVDQIWSQGGLTVIPHPFKSHRLEEELLRRVDAIEGFNARASRSQNLRAQELGKRLGKPLVAGSDAHFCREIASATMTLESPDIRGEILLGRSKCVSTCSPTVFEFMSQMIRATKERTYLDLPTAVAAVVAERIRRP